ncbi:MAG: DUF2974 domain-containing protein [Clostridia bacterium]
MNLTDYLAWRGDVPLSVSPFNPVDNLLLSRLIWSKFNGIVAAVPPDAGALSGDTGAQATDAPATSARLSPDAVSGGTRLGEATRRAGEAGDTDAVLRATGQSERFGDAQCFFYADDTDVDEEKQFGAMTVYTSDRFVNVCFRGTDDTLVGWKEDFNLAFATPVPAQRAALAYLNGIAARLPGPIRVMGHSKGGNLAVYASANAEEAVQARITGVYNDDGPGQDPKTLEEAGYKRIERKINTYIPQSSIIGMLLEHSDRYEIVRSDAVSIFQHDPMSWQVAATDFVRAPGKTKSSMYLNDTLRLWLSSLTSDKRRLFADTLFQVLAASNARTFSELSTNWRTTAPAMLAAVARLDRDTGLKLLEIGGLFVKSALRAGADAQESPESPESPKSLESPAASV